MLSAILHIQICNLEGRIVCDCISSESVEVTLYDLDKLGILKLFPIQISYRGVEEQGRCQAFGKGHPCPSPPGK